MATLLCSILIVWLSEIALPIWLNYDTWFMLLVSSLQKCSESRILSRSSSYSGFSKALGTRHAGSESNECNSIDAVFEVDEAAKMAGNISDDSGTGANHED